MAGSGVISIRFTVFLAAAGILAAGCRQEATYTRTIPEGASPVYRWKGERSSNLVTYWDDRAVSITVAAHFPETWQRPGDGYWNVQGRTASGRSIPFIGVVLRYVNDSGTKLAKIVPGIDLDKLSDSLYFVIDPNVTRQDGRITSIRPAAHLRMILDHHFTPFGAKVYLVPEKESPLTPMPQLPPDEPEGTPISIH